MSFSATITNSSGQVTYTTTVPNGTASGLYNISFTASKSGYSDSGTVTRQVQVQPTPTRIISLSGNLAFGNVTVGSSAQSSFDHLQHWQLDTDGERHQLPERV